jgi:hypothetical protein
MSFSDDHEFLKTWILDHICQDDANALIEAFAGLDTALDKTLLVSFLCEALCKGSSKCIRAMTPYTGPNMLDFGPDEWKLVRIDVLSCIGFHDARVDRAILEILNIPWLSWTTDMYGLLHACLPVQGAFVNAPLARSLIRKGYIEGTEFGDILNRLWDILEDVDAYPKPQRQLVSSLFDELIEMIKECKDETVWSTLGDDDNKRRELISEENVLGRDDNEEESTSDTNLSDDDDFIEVASASGKVVKKRVVPIQDWDDDINVEDDRHSLTTVGVKDDYSWVQRLLRFLFLPWTATLNMMYGPSATASSDGEEMMSHHDHYYYHHRNNINKRLKTQ